MPACTAITLSGPTLASELETHLHAECDSQGMWDSCLVIPASDFDEYQRKAAETDVYPEATRPYDHLLGLASEVGEVCSKAKKRDRDAGGYTSGDRIGSDYELGNELGDVLWYLAAVARDAGFTLREIAELNVLKISSRKARGTIGGSGDDR